MLNWLQNVVVSEDDKDPVFSRLLRNILIVVLITLIGLVFTQAGILSGAPKYDILTVLINIIILTFLFLFLVLKNVLWPAQIFLPALLLLSISYLTVTENGLHDVSISALPVVVFLANLLLGRKYLLIWAVLTATTVGYIGYADIVGITPNDIARTTGIDTIAVGIVIILASVGISWLLSSRFEDIIRGARQNEQAQILANAELQELQIGLELRVEERTTELEQSAVQLQKRAAQFETIAQLARTINSIQDPEALLRKITQLISVSFGFYHVGLFLLDESRQYAVLSAANSQGGQNMLNRKHRLGVGQTGIVGYVTSTGSPRIALDTGADAVFFDNPDLPETRSEMALPLRVGTTIVGALDVQSTEPNAFSEEDAEVLSILADVVSVAIENARLFEESQRVLAEAQTAFSESTLVAWRKITTKRETIGYELSGASIRPLEKPLKSAEIRKAIKTGKISISSKDKKSKTTTLAIPIKLRDQVIGTMNISLPEDKEWDPDEVDITQALAERVGVAVENATLLEESRRRASRESMIGDISAKISASAEIERIMQVAVGELRQALGASEVSLRLSKEETISD